MQQTSKASLRGAAHRFATLLRVTLCFAARRFVTLLCVTSCFTSLGSAELRFASLRCATFRFASLRYVSLRFAALRFASLRCATFRFASLRYVSLRCAALRFASLRCATFRFAALRYVSLRCATFRFVALRVAPLRYVRFDAFRFSSSFYSVLTVLIFFKGPVLFKAQQLTTHRNKRFREIFERRSEVERGWGVRRLGPRRPPSKHYTDPQSLPGVSHQHGDSNPKPQAL